MLVLAQTCGGWSSGTAAGSAEGPPGSTASPCLSGQTCLPADLPAPSPRVYPREMETRDHVKSCFEMFTGALSVIAPNWKQPKVYQQMNGKANWCIMAWNTNQQQRGAGCECHEQTSKAAHRVKAALVLIVVMALRLCTHRIEFGRETNEERKCQQISPRMH